MVEKQLGRLVRVDPKSVWAHEAHEFTPWLAENLSLLNEALGLEIELGGTEIAVGNFAVDIFGKETSTGHEVIIENQLAPTDHSHLGQLLTYAAGLDAKVIVWISPHVRDEHRQAVDWLNRQTPDTITFFAVELELLRIDDSVPAPHFKVVAEPSEFQREVISETLQGRGKTPLQVAYHSFFTRLLESVKASLPGFTNVKRVGSNSWLSFASGRSGVGFNPAFGGGGFRVEIYISTGNRQRNKSIFDGLYAQKEQIEQALGEPLVWERLEKKTDALMYLPYPGSVDPASPPDDVFEWTPIRLKKIREVIGPRLKSLVFSPPTFVIDS